MAMGNPWAIARPWTGTRRSAVASEQHVDDTRDSGDPRDAKLASNVDVDPVEHALADALRKAANASQWSVVEILSRELGARREARAGVVDISSARKRRDVT